MRGTLFILLLLIVTSAFGQRYPYHAARASDMREDVMYLFENNTDNETDEDAWANTSMTFVTSPTPIPEGTYASRTGGGGSYITLPSSYTDVFPDDFTIMFWHNTSTTSSGLMLVEAVSMSSGFAIRINTTTGTEDFDVWTDGTEGNATNFYGPTLVNNWVHYAVTYNSTSGDVDIFVDGVYKSDGGTPEACTAGIDLTGAWKIMGSGTQYIDDFRIFPEELSTTDILSIKNNPGVPFNDI